MPTTVSPRILIVDDEVEITEILADLLSEDYDCLKAGSAEDALARLQRRRISVSDQRHHDAGHERPRHDPARQGTLTRHRSRDDQRHADC